MEEKPELIGEFDCPVCGSKERFCESLANEVKEKGWMRPELNFYASILKGAVSDNTWVHKIPIGSTLPAYYIYLDACLKCGCFYAVKMERGKAVKMGEPKSQAPQGIELKIPTSILEAFGEK